MQFSPTSEHLLLAYGRRHSSLLKSVVIDGEATVPIYTILEVKFYIWLIFLVLMFTLYLESTIVVINVRGISYANKNGDTFTKKSTIPPVSFKNIGCRTIIGYSHFRNIDLVFHLRLALLDC